MEAGFLYSGSLTALNDMSLLVVVHCEHADGHF
jgi:hypothetical protein